MGQHPLLERAASREVRSAKGFREAAAALTADVLKADWEAELQAAPRRAAVGKKHLVAANRKLAASRRPGRDSEHAALALVAWAREGAALPMPDDEGTFLPLHAGVALKTAPADRETGAEDPNWGVERLDLVGVGPDDRLAVAPMRFLAGDAKRVGTGDTPLRLLLEGLAFAAMVQANREPLVEELRARSDVSIAEGLPVLLLVGSPRYWELCRKREGQKGAAWIRELERLAREIGEGIGLPVRFLCLRLEGDPGWSYEDGAPRLTGRVRLLPAWEPGAGRVRPKPRPRKRRETAQAGDEVVEADPSRPVRPYSASEHYTPGDRIEHPTLGLGIVQGDAGPNKIRVHFGERKSTLVHDRSGA